MSGTLVSSFRAKSRNLFHLRYHVYISKKNGKHRCLMSPCLYISWSFRLIPQPCFQALEIRTIQDARPPFSPLPLEGNDERSEAWLHGCWYSDSLSPFKIRFADFCGALHCPSPLPLFQRKRGNRRACSFHLFFIPIPLASPASSLHFAICHSKSAPRIIGSALLLCYERYMATAVIPYRPNP